MCSLSRSLARSLTSMSTHINTIKDFLLAAGGSSWTVWTGSRRFIISLSCARRVDGEKLSVVGSPFWMAPEVLRDEPYNEKVSRRDPERAASVPVGSQILTWSFLRVRPQADVFSYGIILCEIIARIQADPDYLPRTEVSSAPLSRVALLRDTFQTKLVTPYTLCTSKKGQRPRPIRPLSNNYYGNKKSFPRYKFFFQIDTPVYTFSSQ